MLPEALQPAHIGCDLSLFSAAFSLRLFLCAFVCRFSARLCVLCG
jgi:hypothetical protein